MEKIDHLRERVHFKKEQYQNYSFSREQERALWAFFDLAQEYDTLENFYKICVFIPKEFLHFEARLYIREEEKGQLCLVADSQKGLISPPQPCLLLPLFKEPQQQDSSSFFPFKGNPRLIALWPNHQDDEETLGILEIIAQDLSERDWLFFQKFANRIGYNLHVKLIFLHNLEHLKFINTLIGDIEHNVIIPNMYYRVLFKRLKKRLELLLEFQKGLKDRKCIPPQRVSEAMRHIYNQLLQEYEQIEKHYQTVSLFLESLFRRDHFQKGRFVLRKRVCRFAKEVVHPQLERYLKRFEKAGIKIDNRLGGVPDEELVMAVDVGLLSQVYANLFSNALKYTREVTNEEGKKVKFIAFGREIIPDFFGPGKAGIKFNVFSTGPHIPPEEADKIFEEGWRGNNVGSQPGSGRGLHFVKKVIELHGGVVGYEPTPLGNNFYFILPLDQSQEKTQGELGFQEDLQGKFV